MMSRTRGMEWEGAVHTLISPTFHAFLNFYCMLAEYIFGGGPGQLGAEALTMQTSLSAHSPCVQALPFPSALLILTPCREAGQWGITVHRSPVIPNFFSRRLRVRREPLDGMALSLGLCPGDPERSVLSAKSAAFSGKAVAYGLWTPKSWHSTLFPEPPTDTSEFFVQS